MKSDQCADDGEEKLLSQQYISIWTISFRSCFYIHYVAITIIILYGVLLWTAFCHGSLRILFIREAKISVSRHHQRFIFQIFGQRLRS